MAGEAVLLVEVEAPARAFLEQQLSEDGFDVVSPDPGGPARGLPRAAGPARGDPLSGATLEVARAARTVRVAERPVLLSAKEFELLVALAAEPERGFAKDELLRDVWGFRSLGRA